MIDGAVLVEALAWVTRGAESRYACADFEHADLFVAVGMKLLAHPLVLTLADDLPFRAALRRFRFVARNSEPPALEYADWIEQASSKYLIDAQVRLAERLWKVA